MSESRRSEAKYYALVRHSAVLEKNEKKRPETMLMTPIKLLKLLLETWTTGQMWKM